MIEPGFPGALIASAIGEASALSYSAGMGKRHTGSPVRAAAAAIPVARASVVA